jgi:hypothetical protein
MVPGTTTTQDPQLLTGLPVGHRAGQANVRRGSSNVCLLNQTLANPTIILVCITLCISETTG